MAFRPHHLVDAATPAGLGPAGTATHPHSGQYWPEARSISERQVFDRRPHCSNLSAAGHRPGSWARVCTGETRFGQVAEDAQCAAIAAW